MKKFEFNQNGVCTNPNLFFEHGNGHYGDRTKIRTAQCPITLRWLAASDCSYKTGGSSSGVGLYAMWRTDYATEEAAAVACMQECIRRDQETWYQVNSPQATAAMQRRIDELTGKVAVQCSLFAQAA